MKLVFIAVACLLAGFITADFLAAESAKNNGVPKNGGLFTN
jgi:hypothetical protein